MRTVLLAGFIAVLGMAGCGASSDVSRELGARCETSSECDGRCLPPSTDFPDGFCTLVCNAPAECPGGSTCIEDGGGSCLFECVDDTGCAFLGPDWHCKERDVRGGAPGDKAMVCRG